jgi:taurine dioxygenase
MGVHLRPLSDALGEELVGVDLRDEHPEAVVELARAALRDRHLVLVRTGELGVEDQRRFASWFGPINTRGFPTPPPEPEMYISNARADGVAREGSLLKHQDHCFFDVVLPAICLYAEAVPAHGGDTIFVNAELAYERLPEDLRARVGDLSALHTYDYTNDYGDHRFRVATSPEAPRAVHPVAWPHPDTGRPILFVNELMTDSICGLSDDDSEALLAELWAHLDEPEVRYVHRWRVGDLVIWDNRSLQHGRTLFPEGERRSLRRLQVG